MDLPSRLVTTFTGRTARRGVESYVADFLWRSAEKKIIPARGKALVDTQLSIAVPPGTYGRVAPRSGLGEALSHIGGARGLLLQRPNS